MYLDDVDAALQLGIDLAGCVVADNRQMGFTESTNKESSPLLCVVRQMKEWPD